LKYDVVALFLDMALLAFRLVIQETFEGEFPLTQKRIINALLQCAENFVTLAVACLGLAQILHAWALKSILFREFLMFGFAIYHIVSVGARALARNVDARFPDA